MRSPRRTSSRSRMASLEALEPVRLDVLGEHGLRRVQENRDVAALAADLLRLRVPLWLGQCQYDADEGKQQQSGFEHLLLQTDAAVDLAEHLVAGQDAKCQGLAPEAPGVHRDQHHRHRKQQPQRFVIAKIHGIFRNTVQPASISRPSSTRAGRVSQLKCSAYCMYCTDLTSVFSNSSILFTTLRSESASSARL